MLEDILKEEKVNNAAWIKTSNNNFFQITFPIESRARCEKLLNALKAYRIGRKLESIVSVIPCSIYCYDADDEESKEEKEYYEKTADSDVTEK